MCSYARSRINFTMQISDARYLRSWLVPCSSDNVVRLLYTSYLADHVMFLHNYAMGRVLKVKSRYFGDDRWYNSSLKMREIIGTIWLHGACVCVCVAVL